MTSFRSVTSLCDLDRVKRNPSGLWLAAKYAVQAVYVRPRQSVIGALLPIWFGCI